MKIKRKIISFVRVVLNKIIKKLEWLDSLLSAWSGSPTEVKLPEALKDITENIIRNLTSEDPTVKSVALKGKWGIGKTYYVEKYIQTHREIQKKKFIYVSLWGHESIHDIEMELLGSTFNFLPKKLKARKSSDKLTQKISEFHSFAKGVVDLGAEVLRRIWIGKLGPEHILCFDDFERLDKKLRNDFLGWMNRFTEHQHVKVLLVFNDEKLDREQMQETGKTKHYREYFEKVVDIEYEYVPDKNSQVDIVFDEDEKYNAIKDYLKKEVALEGMTNIRIFQKIKLYWSRVHEILDSEFKENDRANWQTLWRGQELMTAVVYQCEKLFNKDINRDTEEQKMLHRVRKLLASHSYYHDIAKLLKNGFLTQAEKERFIKNIDDNWNEYSQDEVKANKEVFRFLRKTKKEDQQIFGQDPLSVSKRILKFMDDHKYKFSLYYFNALLDYVSKNNMDGCISKYLKISTRQGEYTCDVLLADENAINIHFALQKRLKQIAGKRSPMVAIGDCAERLISGSVTPEDIRFLRVQTVEEFRNWLHDHLSSAGPGHLGETEVSLRKKVTALQGQGDVAIPKDIQETFKKALWRVGKGNTHVVTKAREHGILFYDTK